MKFHDCGDCNACCSGALAGSAYGLPFGGGVGCVFLYGRGCSIHRVKPAACAGYQCAWSQGLFTQEMKPTSSNLLISVEVDINNRQFLKVVKLNNNIKQETWDYLDSWVSKNNTYYTVVGDVDETKHRIWLKKN